MYGNTQFGDDSAGQELSADQRKALRRDLAGVAARTRELLPDEFVVGSEISDGTAGPRATVAVQPPIGSIVSADYSPGDAETSISQDECDEIATGLAASAALQVKHALPEDEPRTAQ